MSALTIRRIVVWVISLGAGALVAAIMVTVILPWLGPNAGIPISIEKYGYQYFLWTALPLGLLFMIWLDYFLKTSILPD